MSTFREITRKIGKDLGGKALWTLEELIAQTSTVPNTPYFESDLFEWTKHLEHNYDEIRGELDELLEHLDDIPNFQQISSDQKSITQDDKWKTYFLYGFGYKAEQNCGRCPKTTALIEDIPGMKTAFFSILAPGKHIPEHRGLYKGFIRYHLGLKIPRPNTLCGIKVDGETRHWEEGKSLIFDDTYQHEAWNNSDEIRVVLFMDILRPLKFPGNLLNDGILKLVKRSSFIQDAKKNQESWEERFREEVA
ncbi:aspartyl/asparaginyl beta-hydroxylase domain-containing protein [Aliifodinibius sp. S!AR15-10]|uniref:aspartyl/asparaginyl beta-hydroxylase domain-containing protein n=1 Tax=Aliifodinibius sp. S!AR15-10 TaxID=2950437 RepID=UPI0028595B9B|nr:aspartyl/asparaginyl beta-hydroxylase domain-containing protein [Aliifodinibius sp. S!AR15-10]MDR8390590.1 aspartyl/asparaginyl beta-hydroxylase domain-containing protein [Aliifodinibius sp. S!AR15-10]